MMLIKSSTMVMLKQNIKTINYICFNYWIQRSDFCPINQRNSSLRGGVFLFCFFFVLLCCFWNQPCLPVGRGDLEQRLGKFLVKLFFDKMCCNWIYNLYILYEYFIILIFEDGSAIRNKSTYKNLWWYKKC